MEITKEEYDELKSHSKMLGQIGMYIEDFCNEDDSTLTGVLRLLAEYHSLKMHELYASIDKLTYDE
jgi:hypothetical protein